MLSSLALGATNHMRNRRTEREAGRWEAQVKGRLENRLHTLACWDRHGLRAEERDWIAYRRDLH